MVIEPVCGARWKRRILVLGILLALAVPFFLSQETTPKISESPEKIFAENAEAYFLEFKKHLLFGEDNKATLSYPPGAGRKHWYDVGFYGEPTTFRHEVKPSEIPGVGYEATLIVPVSARWRELRVKGPCKGLDFQECIQKGGKVIETQIDEPITIEPGLEAVYHYRDGGWQLVRVHKDMLKLYRGPLPSYERRVPSSDCEEGKELYAGSKDEGLRARVEDDIREAVFGYQFEHNASGIQQTADVYCLSIDGKDPADAFMKRFEDNWPPVKKASRCMEDAVAGAGDKKAGERGLLFGVGELRWITDTEVEVEGGYYEGDLSSSGNTYHVVKEDCHWVVTKDVMRWIS
ncbi:MAG: hypothetical protein JSV08_04475 [Acidobacteriota bacterium]|nr:MAG: hypothetical protein JSV08_04475 [Acidobacteriota bacterium]